MSSKLGPNTRQDNEAFTFAFDAKIKRVLKVFCELSNENINLGNLLNQAAVEWINKNPKIEYSKQKNKIVISSDKGMAEIDM